jgi:hypothetical protein
MLEHGVGERRCPLSCWAELAGFRVKFAHPNGAGFMLRGEFASEAGLGLGLDAPAGDVVLVEEYPSDFFLILVPVNQSSASHLCLQRNG